MTQEYTRPEPIKSDLSPEAAARWHARSEAFDALATAAVSASVQENEARAAAAEGQPEALITEMPQHLKPKQ